MRFLPVDPRALSLHDMWTTERGDLCVRPGMRRIYSPETNREIVGGFSLFNPHTYEVWHYVFDVADSGALDLTLRIYDEDFVTIQALALNASVRPRVITHAVVHEQVVIASPDFPTLWGWLGSAVRVAPKQDSVNTRTTSLNIPRGICTRWANRVVIADGPLLYISDPVTSGADYAARVFVAQNIIARGAHIFGVHETQDGMLVVVATDGVWGLPSSAAATGIVGKAGGQWFQIHDTPASSYCSSTVAAGSVYVLTRAGVRRVDVRGTEDVNLDDQPFASSNTVAVVEDDYRPGRLYTLDESLIVAAPTKVGFFARVDLRNGMRSWWNWQELWDGGPQPVGVLRLTDGEEMLLMGPSTPGGSTQGGYRIIGNIDYQFESINSAAVISGIIAGNVRLPPHTSPTLRKIHVATDTHGDVEMQCNAEAGGSVAEMPTQPRAAIVGTNLWGDGKALREPAMQSIREQFSERGDEFSIEVAVEHQHARVGSIVLDFEGVGEFRPTD